LFKARSHSSRNATNTQSIIDPQFEQDCRAMSYLTPNFSLAHST
jgi:hypothetical protein